MRRGLLAVTAVLLLAVSTWVAHRASAQSTPGSSFNGQPLDGTISGVVINDEGVPVSGAGLCTEISYDHGAGTSCGGTQTDAQGQFTVHVSLGEIGIYAQNLQGGYWPPAFEMRTPKGRIVGIQTVTLTRDAPSATVTLKIGPRPGELKFDVKDKATGKPVKAYHVRWIGVDNAMMNSNEGPALGSLPIPPGIDVIVTIHAEGYRRWFYLDPSTSQPTLRLGSGEEKILEVELEPDEKN